jgi:MFS family permease
MRENPPLHAAIAWAIITALAVFGIFAPSIFGMEGMNGGYAISFISFFMVIAGIIVIVIYAGRARVVNRILRSDNLLAHWTYTPDEWNNYAEKEYVTERKVKWGLFYVIAGLALFFGVLFLVIDRESGKWVFVAMLALIGIIAFTAWFTAWYNYRQNKKYLGETYITRDAVYMNRQLHIWHGLGARLESVNLDKKRGQQILELTYSMPTRTGLQYYTVRVPVPRGKEREADRVLEKLGRVK